MLDPELTRPDPKYPCQVMPGQYSAYYVKYTPEQLKYLPLQQVTHPGLRKEHKLRALLLSSDGIRQADPVRADDLENLDVGSFSDDEIQPKEQRDKKELS